MLKIDSLPHPYSQLFTLLHFSVLKFTLCILCVCMFAVNELPDNSTPTPTPCSPQGKALHADNSNYYCNVVHWIALILV